LREMVTIGTMKLSGASGTVRKMLHAPTLGLYAVKEVPIPDKAATKALKKLLGDWETLSSHSSRFLKVAGVFWG